VQGSDFMILEQDYRAWVVASDVSVSGMRGQDSTGAPSR
jgi:hypothetical protein